ncbi:MAG: transcriptional regulator [Candidatus Aminicenantes bacterium]|nr:transcriptional regulator [Candidatus Aminicenantes bacterium]
MNPEKLSPLDPLIHSRIRLGILSILASVEEATFNYLKEALDTTDGNLSANLSKLEESGYISIKKTFSGKKPLTTCRITKKGLAAFQDYLKALEAYLKFGK